MNKETTKELNCPKCKTEFTRLGRYLLQCGNCGRLKFETLRFLGENKQHFNKIKEKL